jgi:hypothetical protein
VAGFLCWLSLQAGGASARLSSLPEVVLGLSHSGSSRCRGCPSSGSDHPPSVRRSRHNASKKKPRYLSGYTAVLVVTAVRGRGRETSLPLPIFTTQGAVYLTTRWVRAANSPMESTCRGFFFDR